LWVTAEVPGREEGGGGIRQAYLFEALAAEMHTTLLVTGTVRDESVRQAAHQLIELPKPAAIASPLATRAGALIWSVTGREPAEVVVAGNERATMAPKAAALAADADIVVVEHLQLAPLVPRKPHQARWVITLHNLPSVIAAHSAAVVTRARDHWLWARQGA